MEMDYDNTMDSNSTTDDAYSWRDTSLITLALATSILFFFFCQRPISPAPIISASSEDERRSRRDHFADIAERRASAAKESLQESKRCVMKERGSVPVLKKQSGEQVVKSPSSDVNQTHSAEEEYGENKDTHISGGNADGPDGKIKEEDRGEGESSFATADSVANKESADNNADAATDAQVDFEANHNAEVSNDESNTARQIVIEDEEMKNHDKTDFESTTGDKEKSTEDNVTGHKERHTEAITKLMAQKGEEAGGKKPTVAPSLTIYLILTSLPGSSRIELAIPTAVNAASLLHLVSHASGVPEREAKLIFRGRIITERGNRNVVDEFSIENGSVLHVVGKPHEQKENEDVGDSGEELSCNSRGEEIDCVEEGDGDSEEENVSSTEVVVGRFSSTRARAQIITEIRNSSGEGYYHRAAQLGDLDTLREAVDDGLSDLLHVADSNGWTPLHEAVRAGHAHIVEYLVQEVGLDINGVTNHGDGWSVMTLALHHFDSHHPVTIMVQTLLHRRDPSANPWRDLQEEMND